MTTRLSATRLLWGLVVALGVFSFGWGSGRAVAASSKVETVTFGIEPGADSGGPTARNFRFRLRPGQAVEATLRVWNKTDDPIQLSLYAAEAIRQPQGGFAVDLQPGGQSVGAWTELSRTSVRLSPKDSINVTFEVRAPSPYPSVEGAKEFAGAVVAEPESNPDQPGVSVVQRLAIVVYVEPTSRLRQVARNLSSTALLLLVLVGVFYLRLRRERLRSRPG